MWQEKLQDTAASHPWLEPHEAIKRKTQAPGMQLVDWYGFTVPKTKKEMLSPISMSEKPTHCPKVPRSIAVLRNNPLTGTNG